MYSKQGNTTLREVLESCMPRHMQAVIKANGGHTKY